MHTHSEGDGKAEGRSLTGRTARRRVLRVTLSGGGWPVSAPVLTSSRALSRSGIRVDGTGAGHHHAHPRVMTSNSRPGSW